MLGDNSDTDGNAYWPKGCLIVYKPGRPIIGREPITQAQETILFFACGVSVSFLVKKRAPTKYFLACAGVISFGLLGSHVSFHLCDLHHYLLQE